MIPNGLRRIKLWARLFLLFDELDGWKTLTDAGRDIVYVLLTYFPEWLKQYVLRKAYLRCSQLEAREWLMDDSAWDPGWKEEE